MFICVDKLYNLLGEHAMRGMLVAEKSGQLRRTCAEGIPKVLLKQFETYELALEIWLTPKICGEDENEA